MSQFTNEVLSTVTNFPATQPVSATDLDVRDLTHSQDSVRVGDGTDLLAVNADGSLNVNFSQTALVPTVSRVSVSTTVTTLLAADSNRKRVILHNEAGTLYVKLGTGASSTDYTYFLTANTTKEIEYSQTLAITAIKASGTSNVQVTALS